MVHRKAHWSRVLEMLPLKCLPLKWCSTQCWAPLEIRFPVPGIDEIKIYQFVISDFSSFWEAFHKSQTKFCDGHKFVICENKNIGNAPLLLFSLWLGPIVAKLWWFRFDRTSISMPKKQVKFAYLLWLLTRWKHQHKSRPNVHLNYKFCLEFSV